VKEWFQKQEGFRTIEDEVTIKQKGHIEAEKDYGDIDILTIDEQGKIIYSLECKNTEQAKNIHEMKGELDKYIGRKKGEGLIIHHVDRDGFIQNNKKKLANLITNPGEYKIVSIIVTSEDLPLIYIQDRLPLPFISFPMLKREGASILRNLK
jgi:hypothetical protein